jgi:hypothetical protein
MAKDTNQLVRQYREKKSIKRPHVHAKTKSSKLKTSKNYQKPYKGQG